MAVKLGLGLALLLLSASGTYGLLAASRRVDAIYAERRFELPRRVCPLATNRDGLVSPMCSPVWGW